MRLVVLAVTVAAVVLAGALPATSMAAAVMRFGVEEQPMVVGSPCIAGVGPGNATIHVVWKRRNGLVKADLNVTSIAWGKWTYCSPTKALRVGDTIRATSGAFSRKFTMPDLTLHGDRVTGTWDGLGLPGRTGELAFHAGVFADFYEIHDVTADSSGHWTYPDGAYGGIDAAVEWITQAGDYLSANALVPFVGVSIGRAHVDGGGPAFSDVTVNLRDPVTSALRGSANAATDEYGYFEGTFTDSGGHAVNARVGDRVVSPLDASIDWHVPQVEGTANVLQDFVDGRCHSSEIEPLFGVITVYRTGLFRGRAHVALEADGSFHADFTGTETLGFDPANIKHQDRIVVNCWYDTGDIVQLIFRAP